MANIRPSWISLTPRLFHLHMRCIASTGSPSSINDGNKFFVKNVAGQFLKLLTQLMGAQRVLEIGTFTGYSALAFAEGVPEGGQVVTIEIDPTSAAVARKGLEQANHGGKVKIVEGDAMKVVADLSRLGEKFDIIFLDADKENHRNYYEEGLKMLDHGGLIVADNALWSLVRLDNPSMQQSILEFTQFVRDDTRVEQVMLSEQ